MAQPLAQVPTRGAIAPTPDRVRETLFNWLGQRLDGLACLDLFAGSGALGFEALSRGASRAVMVESDREVARAAAREREGSRAGEAEVVQRDALSYLAEARERFDLAFIDAPYAAISRGARWIASRRRSPRRAGLRRERAAARSRGAVARLREDRAGAVRYALYELVP
jgi:16S rRNA (guanine966-N2)-methyltransferase